MTMRVMANSSSCQIKADVQLNPTNWTIDNGFLCLQYTALRLETLDLLSSTFNISSSKRIRETHAPGLAPREREGVIAKLKNASKIAHHPNLDARYLALHQEQQGR